MIPITPTRSRRRVAAVAAAAVVVCLLSLYLTNRSLLDAPPGADDRRIDETTGPLIRPAEVGVFDGDRHRRVREQHAVNRGRYLKLPLEPIPDDLDEAAAELRPHLRRAARQSGLRPAARDALSRALASVLLRAGGMDDEAYRSLLPRDAVLRLPPNPSQVRLVYETYLETKPPDLEAADLEVRQISLVMADGMRTFRDGEILADAWSLSPGGFALAIGRIGEWTNPSLLDTAMGADAAAYWNGSLAQGALIFHHPPRKRPPDAIGCHAIFIVRARNGDAYPLEVRAWLDEQTGSWWIDLVTRRSSIQVGNSPPLIF